METVELTVSMDQVRFDALKFYMATREGTDPQKELEKMLEELYEKFVPADTREYLDSKLKPAPKPRPKRPARSVSPKPQEKKQLPQTDMQLSESEHYGGD